MTARVVLLLVSGALLSACSSTGTKPDPMSRIEVQENVGFTIVEAFPLDSGMRFKYSQAIAELQAGNHARGIEMLTEVAQASPGATGPLIDLGIAERESGNLEAAERHLLDALELNADHPVIHNELGIVYRRTGRFADARKAYERALSVFPGYHHARRNLGVLCDLYLGDLQCALEAYNAYMTTVPDDPEAAMWIADIRNRLGR